MQICCHSVVINQRVVYVEQKRASRRIIVFVHFSVAPSAVSLIAEMPRVCQAKLQQANSNVLFPSPCFAFSQCVFRIMRTRCDKSCSTLKEGCVVSRSGQRKLSRVPDVAHRMMCYLQKMKTSHTDGRNMAKSNPEKQSFCVDAKLHGNSNRSHARSDEGHLRRDERNPCRRVRAVPENKKFSLAYERASLPRLSSASR